MNALLLGAEFVRILANDPVRFPPDRVDLRTEQSAEDLPDDAEGMDRLLPHTFVFEISATPLDAGGTILRYALNLTVESDPDQVSEVEHAEWVRRLRIKFFGERHQDRAEAEEAITAAMAAGGQFTLRGYDAGNDPIDPSVENSLFRTVFPLRGLAVVAGPV